MWARLIELGFGLWLLASPFVFDGPSSATALWVIDSLAGVLLIVSTVVNYRHPNRRYYLAVPVLGAALIAVAFLSGPHPLPLPQQNHIMVGLTLMMLGIVPNLALSPPQKWSEFEGEATSRTGVSESAPDNDRDRRDEKAQP